MDRIQKTFSQGPVYAGYVTAGDGGIDRSYEAAMALIAGGANLLEIGIPFSDPVADGPQLQMAAQRALAAGTTLADVLILANRIRAQSNVPLVLFSYYSPVLAALKSNFLLRAKQAGIDGILIVDLPLEEADDYLMQCLAAKLDPVFIVAPNSGSARIKKIAKHGRGFLYYACRKGTTGVKNSLPEDFETKIAQIKSCAQLPILVGFGISTRDMATQVLKSAQGFVVASAFVQAISENKSVQELTQLARAIKPNEVAL